MKSKISFGELDSKCLTELPIILDVLSSTGNKLERIFEPFYNDLFDVINTNKPNEREIETNRKQNIFYPLNDISGKIKSLYPMFMLKNFINLIKKGDGSSFYLEFGFFYNRDSEDYPLPVYYFDITKEITKKLNKPFNPLKFYKLIQNNLPNINIRIWHPEQGDYDESVELFVEEHSADKIEDGYVTFKNEILIPFLKALK